MNYDEILKYYDALIDNDDDCISLLSNTSAFVKQTIPGLNWCGFYLLKGEALVLGPFQGKTACTRIQLGHGVCGKSYQAQKVLNVPDVHRFTGHIACDEQTQSELVIPISGIGVFDFDSALPDFFHPALEEFLLQVAQHLHIKLKAIDN